MKFSCSKNEILKTIQLVQGAVAIKTTLPSLNNILIIADKPNIIISATDLEIGIRCKIQGEISRKGSITVPAKKFLEIIRELPESEVELKTDDTQRFIITSGSAKFVLLGTPQSDYPDFPKISDEVSFHIERDNLLEMITKTSFSVCSDETRYVLCGVYFVYEKENVKMVSTDGKRLSYIAKPYKSERKKETRVIVPSKGITELAKILNHISGEVKINVEENQIGFQMENIILVSRLIEGNFPNYEQVIPSSHKYKVKISVPSLFETTKRVSLLTSDRSNSIRYKFVQGKLITTANTQGLGEAHDELPIDYEGEELTIAFNPGFILDILRNVNCDEIFIEITNPLNPGVFKPANGSDNLFVIMPMRV